MPEQLKPCPACGGQAQSDAGHDGSHVVYWVECCGCEMTGPMLRTDMDSAIAAWDQLPRALTWTTEPPKVAGWYWHKNCLGVTIMDLRCLDTSSNIKPIDGWLWAGPIQAPGE